jgi:hypothetical protein
MSEAVGCKCGYLSFVNVRTASRFDGTWHTRRGCGPKLLHEGKTCRGAVGRWRAAGPRRYRATMGNVTFALELVFVEATP